MNKNLKTIKIGLVASLIIFGAGSVFVNAYQSNSDNLNLSMLSVSNPYIKLTIDEPLDGSSFLEPMPLQTVRINIRIVDQFGSPIPDATVHTYPGNSQNYQWRGFTDANGIAYWPEPNVNQDTVYRVKAEKSLNGNYQQRIIYVTIRNRHLEVTTSTNPVNEGDEFYGIVRDQDNQLVAMAAVKFDGKTKYTDINGMTSSFKAPWVDKDTVLTIEASAPLRGYDGGTSAVTIRNVNSPQTHKIYGQVRDYDFKPLKNVRITISNGKYTYTNSNGDYSLYITPKEGGEWITITAMLSGYPLQSVRQFVSSTNIDPIHVNFWLTYVGGDDTQDNQALQADVQQVQVEPKPYQNQQ